MSESTQSNDAAQDAINDDLSPDLPMVTEDMLMFGSAAPAGLQLTRIACWIVGALAVLTAAFHPPLYCARRS
jgi:hypothetical protein